MAVIRKMRSAKSIGRDLRTFSISVFQVAVLFFCLLSFTFGNGMLFDPGVNWSNLFLSALMATAIAIDTALVVALVGGISFAFYDWLTVVEYTDD